jgi:hypothetical protein
MQTVPYRGSQSRRGARGNRGQANMTRGFDEDYCPYEDREYQYDTYNLPNSRIHFSRSRELLPDNDFFDGPPRDYGLNTVTRHVRAMRSEGSRHGLSILTVTESHGNFEPHNTYSNSKIKNKYYTPDSHNIIFADYYCTTDPKHAMYKYHVGELILPYHYFIYMFRLIKHLSKYTPQHIIRTETSLYINVNFPVSRCEFASGPLQPITKQIDYRFRSSKCRYNFV